MRPWCSGLPSSSTTRGGGADAAFQPVAAHPRPAPTAPSAKICLAVCQRGKKRAARSHEAPGCRSGRSRCTRRPPGSRCRWSRRYRGCAPAYTLTSAVSTVPTLRVLVNRMGVSSVPSSSIWTRPVVLPKPLMTWLAAITLSWKISPGAAAARLRPSGCFLRQRVQAAHRHPGTR